MFSHRALFISLVFLLAVGTAIGIYFVQKTLLEIEEGLPITLTRQERDIRILVNDMGVLINSIRLARATHGDKELDRVLQQSQRVSLFLEEVRNNYRFNDVLGISAIHATLNPAMFDINSWLSTGVHNYQPESAMTLELVELRAVDAHTEAKTLLSSVEETSIRLLTNGAQQIRDFRNVMTGSLAALAIMSVSLVILGFNLQRIVAALKQSESRFRSYAESSSDWYWETDENHRFTNVSGQYLYSSEWQRDNIIGYRRIDIAAERTHDTDGKWIQHQADLESHKPFRYFEFLIKGDGENRWISINGVPQFDPAGTFSGYRGTGVDITEHKKVEQELITQSEITANMSEGAFLVRTSNATIVYTNRAFEVMFGYEPKEMIGEHVSILNAPTDQSPEEIARVIMDELNSSGLWQGEVKNIKKNGEVFWSSVSVSTFNHPEYGEVYVSVHNDITERKLIRERLGYQASHDALTGLINRQEFEQRVIRLLSTIQYDRTEHAMCFLDLDQFKVINDTCGHAAGDELLRQLGKLLQGTVRKRDTLARLGGDEFGVLMEHCNLEQAQRVADSVLQAITEFQFFWEGDIFRIGASIGLVAVTDATGNFTELFKQADVACYLAKDLGRNRIHTYHPDDTELAIRHGEMQWVGRINQALDEDHFCLYAQPILSLEHSQSKHFEMLVRMQDDQGGIIPPGAFLPAAERYSLTVKLDTWVVKNTCALLAKHSDFIESVDFLSINLSGPSLTNYEFLKVIEQNLNEHGIPPRKICFEITETVAISNLESAIRFIGTLKDLGCRFSLDDFGSGLSSFGYLKNLPVDYLKIDGMFVKDIIDDPIDHAMVKSINEIGHVMGMKTIAEFVENDEIKGMLRELGVDYAQGYAIGKPGPFENLVKEAV